MTALAARSSYPTAQFTGIPSSISGTIVEFEDIPEMVYKSNPPVPKTFKDGSPIMQTRVILEQPDGSRVALYVNGKGKQTAVRGALKAVGAKDIEQFGHLTLTRVDGAGVSGDPYTYESVYVSFDPTA